MKGYMTDSRNCQKPISISPRADTYCMRPMRHEKYDPKGKCSPNPTEADIKEAAKSL